MQPGSKHTTSIDSSLTAEIKFSQNYDNGFQKFNQQADI